MLSLHDTIDTQLLYSMRATTPKTAARPAPAPVAALMAPALKAGWEGVAALEGELGELGTPVEPALGTRGVEVATVGATGMRGTLLATTGAVTAAAAELRNMLDWIDRTWGI